MPDSIAAWWKEFQQQVPRIVALFQDKEQWDLAEWMHQHLGAIAPELMWEFGPAVHCDGHRLVITPEGRRDLRPLVREILSRAPAIQNWEFYEYRLAEDYEQAKLAVKGRTGGELDNLFVSVEPGPFRLLMLTFRTTGQEDLEQTQHTAFVATESLLGEEVLNRWIGNWEFSDHPGPLPNEISVKKLATVVQAHIRESEASLPERPWFLADLDEGTEWSTFSLSKKASDPSFENGEDQDANDDTNDDIDADTDDEADDYSRQNDLLIGVTVVPEMWHNALSGIPFDSARHSRCGEIFCYLQIDGTQGLADTPFSDRHEIEDAINLNLRPLGLGTVVGGGTGERYSYIELALVDVDAAWKQIADLLTGTNFPDNTWLLFHDDDLASQWRGLSAETPAPPC